MQLALIGLTVGYFLLRLLHLTILPIFNDEAIYLHWGYIETHVPNQQFYSLYDAKQPFLMWLFGLSESLFSDPLWAGRFIAVVAGCLAMIGLYFIGKELFNKRIAILASACYIMVPIFIFYDRQALMESAVTAIGVWSFYFLMKLKATGQLKYAILLGSILGLGFFIKSSVLIFYPAVIILAFISTSKQPPPSDGRRSRLINILVVLLVSQMVSLPLYFQPLFWQTLGSNSRYSLTIAELWRFPWSTWWVNATGIVEIMWWQFTPLIIVAAIIGAVINKKKEIIIWLLVTLIAVVLFTRTISSRYLVAFLPISLLFTAVFVDKFYRKRIAYLVAILFILGLPVYFAFWQFADPLQYLSKLDKLTKYAQKYEYVTGWPSGYGVKNAVDYVEKEVGNRWAVVGVRPDSGNPEDAVFIYLNKTQNIKTVYLNKVACPPADLPVYFISRGDQLMGGESALTEKKRFYKPERATYVGVYQLKECQ